MPQNPQKPLTLQDALLARQQQAPNVQLPAGEGDDPFVNKALRAITTGLGFEEQKPGDAAGAIGGALGAVSLIPPAVAKANGLRMVEKLRENGVFPEHIQDALEFAQERWPRLFGHTTMITPAPENATFFGRSKAADPVSRNELRLDAAHAGLPMPDKWAQSENLPEGFKLSSLEINKNIPDRYQAAQTVGHELLHNADRLTKPDWDNFYTFQRRQLPGDGYYDNASEIRARLQGKRTMAYRAGESNRSIEPFTESNGPSTGFEFKKDFIKKQYPGIDIPEERNLDSRITSLSPDQSTPPPNVDPRDKLYDLMYERIQRKNQGLPPQNPRVPLPSKDTPAPINEAPNPKPYGDISPTPEALSNRMDHYIDKGVFTNNPLERRNASRNVNTIYQQLSNIEAAAPPEELARLRSQSEALKGALKPAPTGQQIPKYQANIINKLVQSGYKPTEQDISTLSDLISKIGIGQYTGTSGTTAPTPFRTGEVARMIQNQLNKGRINTSSTAPLARALKGITGWASVE